MDLTIQVIHAKEFIRVIATGDLSPENVREMLLAAASIPELPETFDILIDSRQATTHISLAEVTKVFEEMTKHWHLFSAKVAILTGDGESYEAMSFMETYANNRGMRVAAFKDYEKAVNWLMPVRTIWLGKE